MPRQTETERRQTQISETHEGLSLALVSFACDDEYRFAARELCRRIESALQAQGGGKIALDLLEKLDSHLRAAFGEHDFFEGRYS